MSKREESNEGDVFFIKHNRDLSDVELSKKLNLKVSVVRELKQQNTTSARVSIADVESAVTTVKAEPEVVETPRKKGAAASNFIVHTGSGRKGIAIMTPGASQLVDENRKNTSKNTGRTGKAIHKPFG